jgi:hypothetical protein
VRHVRCSFRHPLLTFDPAQTLLRAAARALRASWAHAPTSTRRVHPAARARASPRKSDADKCRAAPRTRAAQGRRLPAIEIQFRGILQTQHDRVLRNALFGLPPMPPQNRSPLDLIVVDEVIRGYRLAPAPTGLRPRKSTPKWLSPCCRGLPNPGRRYSHVI